MLSQQSAPFGFKRVPVIAIGYETAQANTACRIVEFPGLVEIAEQEHHQLPPSLPRIIARDHLLHMPMVSRHKAVAGSHLPALPQPVSIALDSRVRQVC